MNPLKENGRKKSLETERMRGATEKMLAMGPFSFILCAESTQWETFLLNKWSKYLIQHANHNYSCPETL